MKGLFEDVLKLGTIQQLATADGCVPVAVSPEASD